VASDGIGSRCGREVESRQRQRAVDQRRRFQRADGVELRDLREGRQYAGVAGELPETEQSVEVVAA
jgi:hypothetical protein